MFRIIFILICLLMFPQGAFANPKVLLIESYHSDFYWDKQYTEGIKSEVTNAQWFHFQMDTKRLSEEYFAERADLAWKYYLECKPDIVVLGDDNALKYLGERFLETDTPVVFLGINSNPRDCVKLHKNITGVLERPLYKRSIFYLQEIVKQKDTKVLFLLDEGHTSKLVVDFVFQGQQYFDDAGVHADISMESDFGKWQQLVLNAKSNGYDYIIIGLYHRVFWDNRHVSSEDVLHWTTVNSPLPVFAFWGFSVGKGKAIGGMVIDGFEQGVAAGKIVNDILDGAKVESIVPTVAERGRLVFSRSGLEQWGLTLPKSIEIRSTMIE